MRAEPQGGTAPTLAQLQSRLAGALLAEHAADQAVPATWITGRVPATDALHAHRNTVLGALSHALRISYPAIDRLVGEAFFDRMAVAYSRMSPPGEPQLASHGAGFAGFVAGFPGVQGLPFLAELAQFEWLLDELGRSRAEEAASQDALDVGGGLLLRLVPTLRIVATRYPVADLREALLADDAARVAALAATPGEYAQALWRGEQGVRARALHPAAARCLELLRAGDPLQQALEAARGALDEAAFMDIIRADLLEAGFTSLTESAS